jgi:hypothetical protein
MNQDVTRQILWNILYSSTLFLYLMLIPLAAAFIFVAVRWYRMVRLGAPEAPPRFDQLQRRLFLAVRAGSVKATLAARPGDESITRHFDSRRRRLHRRRVPEAAGFFGFPYYLVAMMEVR